MNSTPNGSQESARVTRHTAATVAGCIGIALGLLDDWLINSNPRVPKDLGQRVHCPAGHWLGERAATDILVLAH